MAIQAVQYLAGPVVVRRTRTRRHEGSFGEPLAGGQQHRPKNTVAALLAEVWPVTRVVQRRRSLTRPGRLLATPDLVHRRFPGH